MCVSIGNPIHSLLLSGSHTHTNKLLPAIPLPLLYSSTNTGNPQRKKGDRRPPVPHKPANITSTVPVPRTTSQSTPHQHGSSSSSSPPLPRRRSEDTPSPPPPPPPAPYLSQNQRRLNAVQMANGSDTTATTSNAHSEYVMLENARTLDPLGESL